MSYDLSIKRQAQKQISRPPTESQHRVGIYMMGLAENQSPRVPGSCGADRVIYEIDDERRVVAILKVAYRRESYR